MIANFDSRWTAYFGEQSATDSCTLSFNEENKGWVSFKSFVPETGLNVSGKYYTFKNGMPYLHHSNSIYNNFYGTDNLTTLTTLINESSGSVKSFTTVNYEGTQSRVTEFTTELLNYPVVMGDPYAGGVNVVPAMLNLNDNQFYNLEEKDGWFLGSIITDLQQGSIDEFIEKEGKWFNHIKGITSDLDNIDSKEFSYQGLGYGSDIEYDGPPLGNWLLIGDWYDDFDAPNGGFMHHSQMVAAWDSGALLNPWDIYNSYYKNGASAQPGFHIEGSFSIIDPFVMQSGLVKTVRIEPMVDSHLANQVAGCPKYPITAHNISVNRMFPRMCASPTSNVPISPGSYFNNASNPAFTTMSTFATPYYKIVPNGVIANHGLGHTGYTIYPLTDEAGLGFNYFSKPGWPMYSTSQDDDIHITKIEILENTASQWSMSWFAGTFPASIDIKLHLSDFQLDSMSNSLGTPTPLRNKYIPIDIDWYEWDLPQPVVSVIQEYDKVPLNGSYSYGGSQYYTGLPNTLFAYAFDSGTNTTTTVLDSTNTNIISLPSTGTNDRWGYIAMDLNYNLDLSLPTINSTGTSVAVAYSDAKLIDLEYYNTCQSKSDVNLDIIDAVFTDQIKVSPSLGGHTALNGTTWTTAGHTHQAQALNSNFPSLPWSTLDVSTDGTFREYVNGLAVMDDASPNAPGNLSNSSNSFLTNTVIYFEDHPIFDFHVDYGKFYHDLTSNVTQPVFGCMDNTTVDTSPNGVTFIGAQNYDPNATVDDGSCTYCTWGCMDDTVVSNGLGFPDINGNDSNGNVSPGYPDPNGYAVTNYNPGATCSDTCNAPAFGCTYQYADNYDSSANYDDGSCFWSICDDPSATNYELMCNANANYPSTWNTYPGTLWVYPNAVLGTHILPGCGCYYEVPCYDYGSFTIMDWGITTTNLSQGMSDAGVWVANPGDMMSGQGALSNNLIPIGLGQWWQDSSGAYLHDVVDSSSITMTKHMDMTWQAVFSLDTDTSSWITVVSNGDAFNSSWKSGNFSSLKPMIMVDLDNASNNNLEFYGNITPGDYDYTNLDATVDKSCSIAMIQIDVPTGNQYKVIITVDDQYSFVQFDDGATMKVGFGNNWSVADSPISTFLEDPATPYSMGDLVSRNAGKQSLVEGEFTVNKSYNYGGPGGTTDYVFISNVDHTATQGPSTPTILALTCFGVNGEGFRIKDIELVCVASNPF